MDVIQKLEIGKTIREIDRFILDLITERGWRDDATSYNDVLMELRTNLNIHHNTDSLGQVEKFFSGVQLLKLQNMHKRREREIQSQLQKL